MAYVVGLQLFHGAKGGVIRLGYLAPLGNTTYVSTDSFNGFVVSVGSTGFHALQVIDGKDTEPWVGSPQWGAKTRRLVFGDRVAALSCGFDGYKMVYMSAWGKKKPVSKVKKQHDLLSNHHLWFSGFPELSEV
ncbi:hypothetical protein BJX99DRAFT_259432 [Aspergillus californicus]